MEKSSEFQSYDYYRISVVIVSPIHEFGLWKYQLAVVCLPLPIGKRMVDRMLGPLELHSTSGESFLVKRVSHTRKFVFLALNVFPACCSLSRACVRSLSGGWFMCA